MGEPSSYWTWKTGKALVPAQRHPGPTKTGALQTAGQDGKWPGFLGPKSLSSALLTA